MRNWKRALLCLLVLVTLMSCMFIGASAAWQKDSKGWYFIGANGKRVTSTWQKDSKGWVYLDASGYMVTNKWVRDSVGWCYVGADGYAVTNCWKKDSVGWCYLNANGSMTKNKWVKDGGKWYYLDGNGYMVTNKWSKDSIGWVYCGADGAMLTNAWCKDSKGWCYVGADGYAVTNTWKKDSKGWIYLDSEGSMSYSKWVKGGSKWYYVDATGYMVTGWKTIDGDKYYFYTDGAMAASTTVDGITIGADGKAQQGAGGAGEPEVLPDPNKPAPAPASARLRIGLPSNAYVLDYDMNALTQWLEEETGYDIEFILYSGSNISTQIATTIAAGQTLPDILLGVDLSASTINTYGRDGYFVDLTDYYRDADGAAYHFWSRIDSELTENQIDQVMGTIIDPATGNIYSVPTVQKSAAQQLYQPYINQTWLDKLGLSMPTNVNELYNVLKAFKEQDPNGNGLSDEIALIGSTSAGGDVVSWLINMYTYYDPSNPYQARSYQDMEAAYATDSYREAMAFVQRLTKEGLLQPASLSMGATDIRVLVATGTCGIILGNLDQIFAQNSDLLYDYAAMPLWGCAVSKPMTVKANTFITHSCKEPSAAFKVLMALWSYDGSMRVRYGEYGVNWIDADENAVSDYGMSATFKLISDPLGKQTTATWGAAACCFLPWAEGEDAQTQATDALAQHKAQLKTDTLNNFLDAEDDNNPYYVVYSSALRLADPETTDAIKNDLNIIVRRYRDQFAMGSVDINNQANWQAYLTELNNAGMAQLATATTEAYQESWSCFSICGHFYTYASCTSDGACKFCHSTNSLSHDHKFEADVCVYCGSLTPELIDGNWQHLGTLDIPGNEYGEASRELDITVIHFNDDGTGEINSSYYSWLHDGLEDESYWGGSYIVYKGDYYSPMGFGDWAEFNYTVSGDTVVLRMEHHGEYCGTLTLQKSGIDRYRVVDIEGLVIDETVTKTIPIGSEFIFH